MFFHFKAGQITIVILCWFVAVALSAADLPQFSTSNSPYRVEWKQLQEALNAQLPKTALAVAKRLYTKAVKDKNHANIAASAFLRSYFESQESEEPDSAIISLLERELLNAPTLPSKAIIASQTAAAYENYRIKHSWNLQANSGSDRYSDFALWSASQFEKKIQSLYQISLEPSKILESISLSSVRDVIIFPHCDTVQCDTVSTLRPTLYDVLAFRALEHYEAITRKSTITDSALLASFAPIKTFITAFRSDSNQALSLYAKILQFHISDTSRAALLDAELLRLKYARLLSRSKYADTLYKRSLERVITDYRNSPAAAAFFYELAEWYNTHDNGSQAMLLCETAVHDYPASEGAKRCLNLQNTLLARSLNIEIEPNIRLGKPALMSIEYAQITQLYFRIVKISCSELLQQNISDRYEQQNQLISRSVADPPFREWREALPSSPNYRPYIAQSAIPAMPIGSYILLASTSPNFVVGDSDVITALTFTVSSLSIVQQEFYGYPERSGWLVADVETGQPKAGVSLVFFTQFYDRNTRQNIIETKGSALTDTFGFVPLTASNFEDGRQSRHILACTGADSTFSLANIGLWKRQYYGPSDESHIFTDRSLYRPGQIVKFKGIIVRADDEKRKYSAVSNAEATISLVDPNGAKITELKVHTNEFGSYIGTFILPRFGMNGYWTISDGISSAQVRMEEYKRPKFFIALQQPKGIVKIGAAITVRGNVSTFAGSPISQGKARITITRKEQFIALYRNYHPYKIDGEVIKQDSVSTNNKGEFTFDFLAEPDPEADSSASQIYVFTASVDVTDITGETHSAALEISAGYASSEIICEIPEHVKANTPLSVSLIGKNMLGQPMTLTGKLTLEAIPAISNLRRSSSLPVPNVILAAREDFALDFPEDSPVTIDKSNTQQLPPQLRTSLFHARFSTVNGLDSVRFIALKPGKYRISGICTDSNGNTLTFEKIFIAYDIENTHKSSLPEPKPFIAFAEQTTAQPGDTVRFIVGSGYADAHILFMAESNGAIIQRKWISLSNELRAIDIPVSEDLRGGFSTMAFLMHSGRAYQQRIYVDIPWTNKELHISTAVFRDKLIPGAKEEWRLTVKGEKSELATAEMLATMYDASLDAILPDGEKMTWRKKMFPWPTNSIACAVSTMTEQRIELRNSGKYWQTRYDFFDYYYNRYPILFSDNASFFYGVSTAYGLGYTGVRPRLLSMPASENISESADYGGENRVALAKNIDGATAGSIRQNMTEPSENIAKQENKPISPRVNLQETAFFFPQLHSSDSGEFILSFTMPEALTSWRFLAMAHTQDLRVGTFEREVITQKNLMVLPNLPRFMRDGDELVLSASIANLSDKALDGAVILELLDPETMKPLNNSFGIANNNRQFTCDKNGIAKASWNIKAPADIEAVICRISASSGNFSDGEQSILPILPNTLPIIETLPLSIRHSGTKSFTLKNLAEQAQKPSSTLRNRKLTFEFAENPIWLAVQALPMLMEYPHECAEQIFNRFSAYALATRILEERSNIASVISRWAENGSLISPLEKNSSLTSIMLNETPWAAEGKSETERKQRIAQLLDKNSIISAREAAMLKLSDLQQQSGGFAWFSGMSENRVITQYILAGIAHIFTLDAAGNNRDKLSEIAEKALNFADEQAADEVNRLKKDKSFNPEKTSYYNFTAAQYLYIRSYFANINRNDAADSILNFYRVQARRFWQKQDIHTQALTAIALWQFSQLEPSPRNKSGDSPDRAAARSIIASLRERSIHSEEMGMFWKLPSAWQWQHAPIETQAMLIEAFELIGSDTTEIEDMRLWLLRNKQAHDWRTTKATAEACYALLLRGKDYLAQNSKITATVGAKVVKPDSREAGTGYYSASWHGAEITPAMATVSLNSSSNGLAYGGLFWQYIERSDKIVEQKSIISIERTVMLAQPKTNKKTVASTKYAINIGDRLTVRLIIRADRDMEFIHIKDTRPACFESAVQTSGYEWSQGGGYYRSPSDASTSFFMERLPRGTTIIEYDVFAVQEGVFYDGTASVQSLYAPEFAAHSQGGKTHVTQ